METVVTLSIFSLIMALVVAVMVKGFSALSQANARHDAESSLAKAYYWMKRDLEMASSKALERKRVALPGGGDAIWFLSAVDPEDQNPDSSFARQPDGGAPLWRRQVLYYLARPGDYATVSNGLSPAVDPDPNADYYAPHKFLIRKVLDLPGEPESLLNGSGIDSYITTPVDYRLSPFSSETNVIDYKLVADRLLGLESRVVDNSIEVDLSAFRVGEAGKSMRLGQVSLKDHPGRLVRRFRVMLRNS